MPPTATSSCSWSTTSIRSRPAGCPTARPIFFFRGFYCWNSEVGAKTLGIASFYLRAVCQNRNLWGVEDFQEITIRHSKYAASRPTTPAPSREAGRGGGNGPRAGGEGEVSERVGRSGKRFRLTRHGEPTMAGPIKRLH